MTTTHELAAISAAEEWLRSLPSEVRSNTITTQTIKEHWLANSPRQLAIAFADAVKQRVWEGIAYMPAVESKREVRTYTFMGWMRECIGAEPDEFIRTITGHNPSAEEGSNAAIAMVELMSSEEPETLRELCIDHRNGETNMLGWDGLLKQKEATDPVWGAARTALQMAVKNEPGRPKKNASHRDAISDPTLSESNRMPKDRKSRLVRTLTHLKDNPDACKEKGTTPEKVGTALARLVRGVTPSVAAAQREAGLAKPEQRQAIRLANTATDVAKRLIKSVGLEKAKQIALAVLKEVGDA